MTRRKLTHFDDEGAARMVDVSQKTETLRTARAGGTVRLQPETLQLILDRGLQKGDVLGVARIAAIMAAKRVADIIPLCHPLGLDSVEVEFTPDKESSGIDIETRVSTTGKTGVEMEALTAAAVAGLTIYDMCKAVDRGITITEIRLLEKRGGKSGTYVRPVD